MMKFADMPSDRLARHHIFRRRPRASGDPYSGGGGYGSPLARGRQFYELTSRIWCQFFGAVFIVVCVVMLAPASAHTQTLDKVSFGTNWVAEAEHGGHYQ